MERGKVVSRSLFSLTCLIILSTWTLKQAKACVLRISTAGTWAPFGEESRTLPDTRSFTKNYLSTIMAMSGVNINAIPRLAKHLLVTHGALIEC